MKKNNKNADYQFTDEYKNKGGKVSFNKVYDMTLNNYRQIPITEGTITGEYYQEDTNLVPKRLLAIKDDADNEYMVFHDHAEFVKHKP